MAATSRVLCLTRQALCNGGWQSSIKVADRGVFSAHTPAVQGLISMCLVRPTSHVAGPDQKGKRGKSTAAPEIQAEMHSESLDGAVEDNLQKMRKGEFDQVSHPESLSHFRMKRKLNEHGITCVDGTLPEEPIIGSSALPHPIWNEKELHKVRVTHKPPVKIVDKVAHFAVQVLRRSFDVLSGFNRGTRDERIWVNRICFLETVAGVPGMVAAMVRHLHSLRRMRRDHGWIHTLLEEAENERMHLMVALQLKQPSVLFRTGVVATQGLFVTGFSIAYLLSPRFCHRLVGYLEEEAVTTYSKLLIDMDGGPMKHWNTQPAPDVAISYWELEKDATMKDVILMIRADEAHHRVVNHTMASLKPTDYNPYKPGQ